jgi:hypothetical protein
VKRAAACRSTPTRRPRTTARALVVAAAACVACAGVTAIAAPAVARAAGDAEPAPAPNDPAALFRVAAEALAAHRPADAITSFEALSDRGVVDPVVSYDRGLAYAERVRAGGDEPGDLGRAAHGFEEARDLTRDARLERDATRALTAVRAEIARRRARAGDPLELEHGESLGRAIIGLLPENVWAILAAVFSAVLTVGIAVRALAKERRTKVAATTTSAIAGTLLAIAAADLYFARDARLHVREGVVVTGGRLLDARHLALDGVGPVPEGARVTLLDDGAEFSHVALGRLEGWLPSSTILPLAKR